MIFQLPANNWLKGGSVYLRFAISGAGTGTFNFLGPNSSASMIIKRLTVYCGSQVVEQIFNHHVLYNQLVSHFSNTGYVINDLNITEGAVVPPASPNAYGVTNQYQFCIPLLSGLLQNSKALPLWMLRSGGLRIEIELAQTSEVAVPIGVGTLTSYTVSQPELVYQEIQCDPEYNTAIMQRMQSGSVFELPFNSFMGFQTSNSGSVTYTTGLNVSSLSGVFFGENVTANPYGTLQNNDTQQWSPRVLVDSNQLIQFNTNSNADKFLELRRTGCQVFDTSVCGVPTNSTYPSGYYLLAQSAKKFDESGMVMRGTPCSNMVLEIVHNGATAASTLFVWAAYEGIILISQDGSVAVSK